MMMMSRSSGHPPPEVLWLHDGQEVMESEDFHLLREETRCTLLIQEVFPEDTGTYCCRAWNQHGQDQTQARLTVEGDQDSSEPQDGVQPWFITRPRPVSSIVGQHVLLSCAVAGDPFPQYSWTGPDTSRLLTSGGDYELLQKEDVISLLIRRVQKHHAGDYVVSLRNSVGECAAVASLTVLMETGTGREDEQQRRPATGGRGGGAAGGSETLRGGVRGGGGSSSGRGVSRQEANQEQQENQPLLHLHQEETRKSQDDRDSAAAAAATATQGLLKRRVETRERGEEELRQREAQQLDFRSLLGRRAFHATTTQGEESREAGFSTTAAEHRHPRQMDFKANLKGVKPRAEEERKVNSPQQVDFRAVLGKKGAAGNGNKLQRRPGRMPPTPLRPRQQEEAGDPEKNGESGKTVNNCVDGGINEEE
ncbi:hypothetical protein INR49_022929 [Caranx melampygus]|nr:hypothetical protein INR49_022929 [Caranx melampygus]